MDIRSLNNFSLLIELVSVVDKRIWKIMMIGMMDFLQGIEHWIEDRFMEGITFIRNLKNGAYSLVESWIDDMEKDFPMALVAI